MRKARRARGGRERDGRDGDTERERKMAGIKSRKEEKISVMTRLYCMMCECVCVFWSCLRVKHYTIRAYKHTHTIN